MNLARAGWIELAGVIRLEPAHVALPDGAHGPAHFAVYLPDIQFRRKLHLAHGRPDVLAPVDARERLAMHEFDRRLEPVEAGTDEFAPGDRIEMSSDEHLGFERTDAAKRVEIRLHVTILVAANGVEIGKVRKQRPEYIAREKD